MIDRYLTVDEIAERLRVPKSWIYMMAAPRRKDKMPSLRAGKYLRFQWDEVERWLRERLGQGETQ